MISPHTRTPARLASVEARLDRAAELVEEAQHALERACAELSSIVGGIPLFRRSAKLSDGARALWERIEYLPESQRKRLGLDHEPDEGERLRYGMSGS